MCDVNDDVSRPVLHWYDFVCPFCYIGRSRTAILVDAGLDVISLPFQSHPDIPAGGLLVGPRRGPRYKMIEREAAAAGLPLQWPARIANSGKALAAAEWVRRHQPDAFASLQHKLFEAYFAVGEDIDNQAVIDRHATTAGADLVALHAALADGSAYAGVEQAEMAGQQLGVYGTPAWLFSGRLVAGLLPAPEFQCVVREAVGRRARSERAM